MGLAVLRALHWLACLALAKSLDRGFPASEIEVEVDDKATFHSGLRAVSRKGLHLAGGVALRQLGSRPRSGCQHLTNLVHTLQRSRANVSTEEAPLSYMHIDHPVHQVGLAVFDLWEDPSNAVETLDEDANQVLQPFLPDVAMWREACSSSDKTESTKVLLVLAGVQEPPRNESMWSEMAREFGAYVTRKVLRKRPEEIYLWLPSKDETSLAQLLSKKNQAECFRSVAVLSGAPWEFAWSQHFRCNAKEGRLVLHFVEQFMQAHPMESKNTSHGTAQAKVCFTEGNELGSLQRLELCELTGRAVHVQVAPSAMEMTRCDAFLALPGKAPTGAELWLRESSSLVEILSQTKMPTTFVENLALLTGAKHFTLQRGEPTEENDELKVAARAILALNRAGIDAVDGSLDESIYGVGELEGCEEFYHPEDGWMQGWRDVARSLKLAQRGETIGRAPEAGEDLQEAADGSQDDLEDDTSQTAKSEEDRDHSADAQEEDDEDKKAESDSDLEED